MLWNVISSYAVLSYGIQNVIGCSMLCYTLQCCIIQYIYTTILYYVMLCFVMLINVCNVWAYGDFYDVHGHVNICCFCWCVEGITFINRPESLMLECYLYIYVYGSVVNKKSGSEKNKSMGRIIEAGGLVVIIHKTLDDLLAMFAFNCVAKPHVICRVMWVRVKQTHKRLCVVGPWDRRHRFLYLAGSILPSSG